MTQLQNLKSSIRRRFEFIEFQLAWEGSVGRKKLQDQFSISMQQATKDLNIYMDSCPGNMTYDPRQKTYIRSKAFRPKLTKGEASEYLMHLEMLHQGYREKSEIWVATIPRFDAVSAHSRPIAPKTLKEVLNAIRTDSCIQVNYVSLSSDNEQPRALKPHAIASDGHRWHVRAFDFGKDRYSDFVLSRIESALPCEIAERSAPPDTVWETFVSFILKVDTSLERRQRDRLEFEYGMKDGRLHLEVRQAMLFYYLRYYGFNPLPKDSGTMRNESSFHLKIANLKAVERCLQRRQKR